MKKKEEMRQKNVITAIQATHLGNDNYFRNNNSSLENQCPALEVLQNQKFQYCLLTKGKAIYDLCLYKKYFQTL